MKHFLTLCLTATTLLSTSYAQDSVQVYYAGSTPTASAPAFSMNSAQNNTSNGKYPSPYKVTFKRDAPIIAAGIALTGLGVYLIGQKDSLTNAQLALKTRDKVPGFDRGNAGYYSLKADKDSYVPFKFSFALPVVMALIDGKQRDNILPVLAMYVETMAVTGTLFTMTTGTIARSRPFVHGTIASASKRRENDSQRSFYAGHTAATASATFFAAKVFSDFNPDSKLKPVVWVVAAATPALVGYLRYKAGMHFLSDNILGYVLGAGAGILIPEWHKTKMGKSVSLVPEVGNGYKGLAMTYTF